MLALLRTFSWQELRRHPWRGAAAIAAVMLGVALALAVHLINASALSEFSAAVRSVNGQPDLELRATRGGFDEALFARVGTDAQVEAASPVLELATNAFGSGAARVPLRVVGLDPLVAASLAPALVPQPSRDADRMALFAPATVFLNPAARDALAGDRLQLQAGLQLREVTVAGSVTAAGAPLAVMDIAAAQDLFGRAGELSRIDVKLRPGADRDAWVRSLALPAGVVAAEPGDATQRVSNLSRAYRVNLTVLALVALFTGAFLVFSVLSLSVARRSQQLALLGVLGLDAGQRLRLVLAESAALGVVGSVPPVSRSAPCWRIWRCASWAATWAAATSKASRPACTGAPRPPSATALLGVHGSDGGRLVPGAQRRAAAAGAIAQGPARQQPPVAARAGSGWRCWRWRRAGPAAADRRHCRWPRTCRWACCWWAASPRCRRRFACSTTGSRRCWRTACCRCSPWSARAACARRRPWRSAAWWPRSAWRWR
jgi:hypothetical protein